MVAVDHRQVPGSLWDTHATRGRRERGKSQLLAQAFPGRVLPRKWMFLASLGTTMRPPQCASSFKKKKNTKKPPFYFNIIADFQRSCKNCTKNPVYSLPRFPECEHFATCALSLSLSLSVGTDIEKRKCVCSFFRATPQEGANITHLYF